MGVPRQGGVVPLHSGISACLPPAEAPPAESFRPHRTDAAMAGGTWGGPGRARRRHGCSSSTSRGGAARRAGAAAPRAAAFPASLPKAVQQAREAAKRALADGARLVEVEVPVGDITGVPGDGEGANEMTESMRATYDFLRAFSGREEGVR